MRIELEEIDFLSLSDIKEKVSREEEVFFVEEAFTIREHLTKKTKTKLSMWEEDGITFVSPECRDDFIFEFSSEEETSYWDDWDEDNEGEDHSCYLVGIKYLDINSDDEFVKLIRGDGGFMTSEEVADLVENYLKNR